MNLSIDALVDAIEAQQKAHIRLTNLFGIDEYVTMIAFDRLQGMFAAFEALTGMAFHDWQIDQILKGDYRYDD